MEGGVEIGGKYGDEKRDQTPARELAQGRNEHADASQNLCDSTDKNQCQRPRQERRHDREIKPRRYEMAHARRHETKAQQPKQEGAHP